MTDNDFFELDAKCNNESWDLLEKLVAEKYKEHGAYEVGDELYEVAKDEISGEIINEIERKYKNDYTEEYFADDSTMWYDSYRDKWIEYAMGTLVKH